MIACSAGHEFARKNVVRVADLDGQPYLARINCEYFDALRDVCHANGSRLVGSFRSEREDWILTMVAAGMGICFLPEFSNTIPGVISRQVVDPSVAREVSRIPGARRQPDRIGSQRHALRVLALGNRRLPAHSRSGRQAVPSGATVGAGHPGSARPWTVLCRLNPANAT